MKSSPRHSPRGSISLPHTESIHISASEIDQARSPHALDAKDPNYDPFDDEDGYVDFYMTEETENLGTLPYHVVQRSKKTAATTSRFGNQLSTIEPPLSLKVFKQSLEGALEELLTSSDFSQFIHRVKALDCSLYHDELVAHLIRTSLDFSSDLDRDKIAELITLMRKSGHVSSGQLSRAFEKLFLTWEDILLDVPSAVEMISRFLELAIVDGCLPNTFVGRLPESFLTKLNDQDLNSETFPELVSQLKELQAFKKTCYSILIDFFASYGAEPASEIGLRLAKNSSASLRHEFVRRALNMSLDKEDNERELVSCLLSNLRDSRILAEDDFLWGFSHLLGSLPDLVIDCPQAISLVSKFLIRAIADEVLPPSFLENAIRLGLGGPEGVEAAEIAKNGIESNSVEWADLRNVWGKLETNYTKKWENNDVETALSEYLASHDKAEMCRLMREWALCTMKAVFVIKRALLKAMDGNGNDCLAVVDLLDYAVKHEELKDSDILRAMHELDTNLDDLKLDIPDAAEMLDTFGGLLRTKGLLMVPSPRESPRA